MINGQRFFVFSGEVRSGQRPVRAKLIGLVSLLALPCVSWFLVGGGKLLTMTSPELWRDLLEKVKAAG